MAKARTADEAALDALIPADRRADYQRGVDALVARNQLIGLLEEARQAEGTTKRALAERAGLEEASVRRMLTAKTANPTAETAFRLLAALSIRLEAQLPSGERIRLVDPKRRRGGMKAEAKARSHAVAA